MTPLQKLEQAILTLQAHQMDTTMSKARREAMERGATEVLVEAAIDALPAIEIVNARNKYSRKEVAA